MRHLRAIAVLATAGIMASAVLAQEERTPEQLAVELRQAHMNNFARNLSTLGAMAQGNAEYDAAQAQSAADNLYHFAMVDWDYYWLPGTSSEEMEGTRALPAIWENREDFESKHAALQEAATALQGAAGTDLAALQAAMGGVGQACGSCHENFRADQ